MTKKACVGFTLLELLVVVAIIAILSALLLTVLSGARARGQSAVCTGHLKQVGLAMEMYVSDNHIYPQALGGKPFRTWADQLAPYNPLNWTNATWHCPTYIARGGTVVWEPPPPTGGQFKVSNSYAYNAFGMGMTDRRALGLGDLNLTVHENRIAAPSELYEVGDTRPIQYPNVNHGAFFAARAEMDPWRLMGWRLHSDMTEAKPPHADGYNLLFADGHVALVKRRDYLYPPRTAQNWNRDNKAHPEVWPSTSEWCVSN